MATYENSSSFYEGIAGAVREVGAWDKLMRALEPDLKRVLETPREQRWWTGSLLARIVTVLERVTNAQTIERIAYLAVKSSVAPVAMPLIKVTFAVAGASPSTILSRASTFGSTALRGVELTWRSDTKTSGVLIAAYPEAVPAVYGALWRGTLQMVFELTRAAGTVGQIALESDSGGLARGSSPPPGSRTRLIIPVRWEPGGRPAV